MTDARGVEEGGLVIDSSAAWPDPITTAAMVIP